MAAQGEGGGMPALVIVDVQNDFVEAVHEGKRVVSNCSKLLECARESGIPIFHVRRGYRKDGLNVELPRLRKFMSDGWTCVQGTKGAEAPRELAERDGEVVIAKPRWSAFFQTELDMLLRRLGVDELYVAGIQTPNCIRATVFDAIALDYNVFVVDDATSAKTPAIHEANMRDMAAVGAKSIKAGEAVKAWKR